MSPRAPVAVSIAAVAVWASAVAAQTGAASTVPTPAAPDPQPAVLDTAVVRDVPLASRIFDRGIPVTDESFSPDGFHFAYLDQVPGGFLDRKPRRCTFLLDFATGENRPLQTPKGVAVRIGGWDPTGRYLLIETQQPDLLAALTGSWTTYHWILDVVTGEFPARKPFTGQRDDRRFRWKERGTFHGIWDPSSAPVVLPLVEGELSRIFHDRQTAIEEEDARRMELARKLALGAEGERGQVLAEVLPRLDAHWTRRAQRDPIIADLYGVQPRLRVLRDTTWVRAFEAVDHVAVLDRGLCLVTEPGERQSLLDVARLEVLPLPRPPDGLAEALDRRWEAADASYDESDPLPRDRQYRRLYEVAQGTAYYFHYVMPDRSRVLLLYAFEPSGRTLRVVDLPESWRGK
ncbi:MAG: hypothetical protein ACT4PE_17645 [Candidatus Eiseniibacteriota bacterium]